jgi:hypothetical protein
VQLGELQSQMSRFNARDVNVVALSVDPVKESRSMVGRMKLSFALVSDQHQSIMKEYGVRNPDTQELALHAVFILDEDQKVFYRKVASRRPVSQELLDAIDYHYGRYPLGDKALVRGDIPVAYPRNNFQALIELGQTSELPKGVIAEDLAPVLLVLQAGKSDAAVITFRQWVQKNPMPLEEYLQVVRWLTINTMSVDSATILAGRELDEALIQLGALREQRPSSAKKLETAQLRLENIRSKVRENAGVWRLSRLRGMLRGYRELAIAGS